jgi:hypothetical protein
MPEFDRSDPVTVAINAHSGVVKIHAEERVSVLADVEPYDGSESSRQAAADTVVSLEGDKLTVRAPDSSGWNWRGTRKLRITVRVPLDSSLAVKTASGDVTAEGRYAAARVEASSGDIRIGDVNADAASGDITIESVGASAKVDTASGDIEVGVLRQGDARIGSASGDVKVGVLAGTGVWLDVSTASGKTRNDLDMTADGGAPPTGANLQLRIRTASGDIRIARVLTSNEEVA